MLFPPSKRVIYEKNPLVEVICQLRFPRVLRIDSDLPAAFQERIRAEYPVFTQTPTTDLGALLPPQLAQFPGLEKAFGGGQQRYDFASADGSWRVSLTSHFLAVTTNAYRRWEAFKAKLAGPASALQEIYTPAFFSRVGLRYQDVIQRSRLELDGTPWNELIQDRILGELADAAFEQRAQRVARDLLLSLDTEGDRVRVQHGFAQAGDVQETCYLIDGDFYFEGQTEPDHAITVLDRLNGESGRLFRWCIKERLHEAMGPTDA